MNNEVENFVVFGAIHPKTRPDTSSDPNSSQETLQRVPGRFFVPLRWPIYSQSGVSGSIILF
jgi:hypothetical protein